MNKLLIIADDFTGALDTGIQFTNMGIRARIITDFKYDFSQLEDECSLLVVNTDSRPLSPEDAYQRVYALTVNAKAAGFQYVYKKTDSGLRGNIGMEIKAVMDAYEEEKAYFIPALPNLNRITRNGIQYIDGIPVKESVFGQDPFEPVQYSDVAEILKSQFDVAVTKVPQQLYEEALRKQRIEKQNSEKQYSENESKPEIMVFDVESNEDLLEIAKNLKESANYTLVAGCAGFASVYETLIQFPKERGQNIRKTDGLLALCGSVNAITVKQVDYAQQHGFIRENLVNEQKLNQDYLKSKEGIQYLDSLYKKVSHTDRFLIETLDTAHKETVSEYAKRRNLSDSEVRFGIADTLGTIAAEMVKRGLNHTISMTGGDTLMGFMRYTNTTELIPICEIGKGAVMSEMNWNGTKVQVISKSGGFGEEDIFQQMYRKTQTN